MIETRSTVALVKAVDQMIKSAAVEYEGRYKVGYYLTDVSEPGRGNTLILPGSHLQNEIECEQNGRASPEGAEPLCVPAGSAMILDRRTWHSRSANQSDMTRKVIWYGYSYRWLRPKDEMTVEHLFQQLDPIRRQLLGDGLSANATCGLGRLRPDLAVGWRRLGGCGGRGSRAPSCSR